MPRTNTLRQRLRYRFDNTRSRGLWAVLLWLGVIALAFFLLIATVIAVTGIGPGDESTSYGDGLWYALTGSLDPGTFSGDEGSGFRGTMLAVTIIGIFLAAAIIGLVSSAIDSRVHALRRGKSIVVEEGHTLVIGYRAADALADPGRWRAACASIRRRASRCHSEKRTP